MSILSLIATNNFITVNRTIASIVGLEAAVILGELASEATYWSEHNPEYDGSFYSTIENLEQRTYLSAHSQRLALNRLQEQGWIEVEKKGMPARRYIRIHEEEIARVVNDKSSKFLTTRDQKNERQVVKNFNTNNNINKENRKREKSKGETTPAVVDDKEEQEEEGYAFLNRPADSRDIKRLVQITINAYPYIQKKTDPRKIQKTWEEFFTGENANTLYRAIKRHVRVKSFFPSIAEIQENIKREGSTTEDSSQEPERSTPEIPEEILKMFDEN